jgi:hypothetical protein
LIGFEYGGGIKHLKIGVAEVTDIVPDVSFTSIPELTCIRNIIYQDENFLVRKAVSSIFIINFQQFFTMEKILKLRYTF